MFKRITQNLDGGVFYHVFAGKQAGRYIGEILDKVGKENIPVFIEHDFPLTEVLPEDYKAEKKQMCQPYKDVLPGFTDEEVYGWVPPQHRCFIESHPGGKDWAIRQVQQIRSFLIS